MTRAKLIFSLISVYIGCGLLYASFNKETEIMDFVNPWLIFLILVTISFFLAVSAARSYMKDWQEELAEGFKTDATKEVSENLERAVKDFKREVRGYRDDIKDFERRIGKDVRGIKSQYNRLMDELPERKEETPLPPKPNLPDDDV